MKKKSVGVSKIKVLRSKRARRKMVDHMLSLSIALGLQGRVFVARIIPSSRSAEILDGQGVAPWTLPFGSYKIL